MKRILLTSGTLIIIALVGCNMPLGQNTQPPDAAFTAAAMTVEAELTRIASLASATPPSPTSTPIPPTAMPTNTLPPTRTNAPIPCNWATFVTDVTIPDNTVIHIGQSFRKVWRLRNGGSCTWNSSYQLVFYQGDPMGPPIGYVQPLTSGFILSGQNVDVSVDLTAPMTAGTFTGRWAFREPGGTIFSTFIVKIQVPAPIGHSVTLNSLPGESGVVRSDGHFSSALIVGDTGVGGSPPPHLGLQLFLAFDISAIPSNATITDVMFDLTNNTKYGNPFGGLGCLKAYPVNYVTPPLPTSGDFVAGAAPANEDHDWCAYADLASPIADNDFKIALQSKVGASRLRYRFQFNTLTNGNNYTDELNFSVVKLIITYATP